MSSNHTLSAVIIAKNEERLIEGCLKSVGFCDETVVVVDQSTTDATEAIAKKYTPHVYRRAFDNFAGQKNFAIEQATTNWVLIIDADERVDAPLRQELTTAITEGQHWGYDIPTKPYVFGVELKHSGWAPSYHLRLFRADGRYEGEVHETITPGGTVGKLAQPLVHYNYFDVAHFITKLNQYTSLEATKLSRSGAKFKTSMLITGPAREFLYRYLKQSGWRDGFMGLVIALLMAFYRFTSILKFWELQRQMSAAEVYKKLDGTLK